MMCQASTCRTQTGCRLLGNPSPPSRQLNRAPHGTSHVGPRLRLRTRSSTSGESVELTPEQVQKKKEVEAALETARTALNAAEKSLEALPVPLEQGPADPVKYAEVAVPFLKTLAGLVLGLGLLSFTQAYGLPLQIAGAVLTGIALGTYGYRRGSLSVSGGISAAFVGGSMLACGLRAGGMLLAFFFSSSALTRLREDLKDVDDAFKAGGGRDYKQVFSNALVPALWAGAGATLVGLRDLPLGPPAPQLYTFVSGALLGYLGCCCGDTWASELGQLSTEPPRLITTGKPVRKGTNGAVSKLGLLSSIVGGFFMGLSFYGLSLLSPTLRAVPGLYSTACQQTLLIFLGVLAGVLGSVTDSVLGATVQFTGYNQKTGKVTSKRGPDVTPISGLPFLSNNGVNITSATFTSLVIGLVAMYICH